jgi:hypothetical protein
LRRSTFRGKYTVKCQEDALSVLNAAFLATKESLVALKAGIKAKLAE